MESNEQATNDILANARIQMPPEPTALEEVEREKWKAALMEAATALRPMKYDKKTGVLKELGIPINEITERFWGFLSHDTVMTRKTANDHEIREVLYRAEKCKSIDEISQKNPAEFRKARNDLFNIGLQISDRDSRGVDGYERKMLITSSSESVASQSSVFQEKQAQAGFMRRLLGLR